MGIRFAIAICLAAVSSSGAFAAPELSPREKGDLAIKARAILNKYCVECHQKGKDTFDILEYTQLTSSVSRPIPPVNLEKIARSQIIEFIEDGSMPPGGRDRPNADEIKTLRDWLNANAPQYPRGFDDASTLQVVLDDWKTRTPPGNFRYVSLAHRIVDGQKFTSLESEQTKLQDAINAATTKANATVLQPVDVAGTVFRIDIEKLGWAARDQFKRVRPIIDVYQPMIPYDLILLENPFAMAKDAKIDEYHGNPKHVTPVPYLRGDWLADVLAPDAPLAADLKSIVEVINLNEDAKAPSGPKIRAFEKPKTSIPCPPPPIAAWYSGTDASAAKEFELNVKAIGTASKTEIATLTTEETFSFQATVKKRRVRFVLLNLSSSGNLTVYAIKDDILNVDEPKMIATSSGNPFRIASIPSGAETGMEYYIMIAAEGDAAPVPIVVQSKHSGNAKEDRAPVTRFIFDKTDPSKAFRKVIPITVTRVKKT